MLSIVSAIYLTLIKQNTRKFIKTISEEHSTSTQLFTVLLFCIHNLGSTFNTQLLALNWNSTFYWTTILHTQLSTMTQLFSFYTQPLVEY